MSTNDSWNLYVDTRDRFIELLRSLDVEQAATTVPSSPGWTVRDVASHGCGLNAEVATGRREGLGTDERTALQVEGRAGHSVDEICDEWMSHEAAMESAIDDDPFFGNRLAGDLIVHLHDIRHALGLSIDPDDDATTDAAHTYVFSLQNRVQERLGARLDIALTDGTTFPAGGTTDRPSISLRATPYDFLRSVTGRRSRRQIEALDWSGDPARILDKAWSSYGELPADDSEV